MPAGEGEGRSGALSLAYRAPLHWAAMCAYLRARAIPGVEAVSSDGRYQRTVSLDGRRGHIAVGAAEDAPARSGGGDPLRLEVSAALVPVLQALLAKLRRAFDLDADPRAVGAHLSRDPVLAPLVARRPGLRAPGAVDGFELALRAVLGQQVTVRGASTLAGRLVRLVSDPLPPDGAASARPAALTHLPLTAERLADASPASLARIGLPRARVTCIMTLARAVAGGALPELAGDAPAGDPSAFARRLMELPGIGPWTAAYVAMRALHWRDAFPDGDLGLRKAMGGLSPARLRAAAAAWRPWRAYAAQHLWASLGDAP